MNFTSGLILNYPRSFFIQFYYLYSRMKVANSLSPHLFWDTNISELDFQKNKRLIIDRVLHRGTQQDWDFITKVYKKDDIVEVVCNLPSIAPKEANFVALLFNIDKNQMKCYTNKRLNHYY